MTDRHMPVHSPAAIKRMVACAKAFSASLSEERFNVEEGLTILALAAARGITLTARQLDLPPEEVKRMMLFMGERTLDAADKIAEEV